MMLRGMLGGIREGDAGSGTWGDAGGDKGR